MNGLSRAPHGALAAALCLAAWIAPATAQSTMFRVTDVDLRDPHIFINFIGCQDVTDTTFLGFSFNSQVQAELQGDADGDGFLDVSYVLEFLPLAQAQSTNFVATGRANCTAPANGTTCGPIVSPFTAGDAPLSSVAPCLAPVAGTVRPYAPAITSTAPSCFGVPPASIAFDFAGVLVSLQETQFAATFVGTPATQLTNGLIRGFLPESVANATVLPASYPLVGGQTLASLLPGGTGNCAATSDKDLHDGTPGWWFYFNYSAVQVAQLVPLVFRDGFEGP